MIDLTVIINEIEKLIAQVKRWGTYTQDGHGEVEEWAFGSFMFVSHVALGEALYINEVCVWNNW
jgi:hypothetical protein